jgi:DNA-binding Lrp family transcriptional regulator
MKREKIEWKLISELMKNSKNSDRELAKIIGVSQPTITRTRSRLEKEGYIKEYTMIPDFSKLGFEIMSVSLTKMKKELTEEERVKVRELGNEILSKHPFAIVMAMSGMGLGYDRVVIAFHENYGSYMRFVQETNRFPNAELYDNQSFLVSTSGDHYMPLTFSELANYLSKMKEKKE